LGAVDVYDVEEEPGGEADIGVGILAPPVADELLVAGGVEAAARALEGDLRARAEGEHAQADRCVVERGRE
jgi:hypothetical protein